ncbi:MAG: hypothetical protein ACT4O3_09650 [Elusimicrobiota bacterium]
MTALAAALGAALWNYFPVGSFHDDAVYWLLSESLRAGRYALPGDPAGAGVSYLPGYPALLALAGLLDGPAAGHALSLALTFGGWAAAWRLFKPAFGPSAGVWMLAWFALQPISLRHGAALLSEPLFVFLSVAGVALHDKARAVRDGPPPAALAALCAYACWVRPLGAVLGAALAADALLRRRFRLAGILLAAVALSQGALFLWTARDPASGADIFLNQWRFALQGAPPGTLVSMVLSNLSFYADLVPFMAVFPLGRWAGPLLAWPALGWAVKAAVWAGIAWGLAVNLRGERRAVGFFFALYAGVVGLWLRADMRYVMPLIFPALFLLAEGLAALGKPSGTAARIRAAAALGALLCLPINIRGAAQSLAGRGPRLPEKTFAWLKENLPPGSVLGAESTATVYLHAGVPGAGLPRTYAPEEFLRRLLDRGVTHVLVEEAGSPPARPDVNDWMPVARLMVSHAGWYVPVRRLEEDGKILYAVAAGPAEFRASHDLYTQALAVLRRGGAAEGRKLLEKSLAVFPAMTPALDRLAALAAAEGDRVRALRLLDEALTLWPASPSLRYHRHLASGRAEDLEEASRLARLHGHWPLVWETERRRASFRP